MAGAGLSTKIRVWKKVNQFFVTPPVQFCDWDMPIDGFWDTKYREKVTKSDKQLCRRDCNVNLITVGGEILVALGQKARQTHKMPRLLKNWGLTNRAILCVHLAYSPEATNIRTKILFFKLNECNDGGQRSKKTFLSERKFLIGKIIEIENLSLILWTTKWRFKGLESWN
jgi:hypothetical protein